MWIPDVHAEAAWASLHDETADVIATDHSPHTREEKEIGWKDMFAAPGGSPMVQHYLSLLLNEVAAGRLSLDQIVRLCSTAPARLMGIYPQKGTIRPGSDADLVVLDLDRKVTISAADSYYKCGWTPLEGRSVQGVPVMTIRRGEVIARDGVVTAAAGSGRLVRART
jgi:dihydroorotase-like cyclic amidohydrolase